MIAPALPALVLVVAVAGLAAHLGRSRTRRATGRGIARLEPTTLGGHRQWLLRGRARHATALLFLHGGPGSAHLGLAHAVQGALEEHIVVVQVDPPAYRAIRYTERLAEAVGSVGKPRRSG